MSEQRRPTRAFRVPVDTDVYVRTSVATACPLGPIETQVLSRIDGQATVSAIAGMQNLSVRETATIMARLAELGATERRSDDVDTGWEASASEASTAPPPRGGGPRR